MVVISIQLPSQGSSIPLFVLSDHQQMTYILVEVVGNQTFLLYSLYIFLHNVWLN